MTSAQSENTWLGQIGGAHRRARNLRERIFKCTRIRSLGLHRVIRRLLPTLRTTLYEVIRKVGITLRIANWEHWQESTENHEKHTVQICIDTR